MSPKEARNSMPASPYAEKNQTIDDFWKNPDQNR